MSKKTLVTAILAILALVAGGAVIAFATLKDTPVVRDALEAVGIEPTTYTQADVDAALLTLADLPGYAVAPDDNPEGDETDSMSPCGLTAAPSDSPSLVATRRELAVTKGAFGPYLSHATGLVPSGSTLDDTRAKFAACPSWTEPDGDVYTVAEANYGTYGDETYSIKMTITTSLLGAGVSLVMIRKGNLLSMIVLAGFPDVNGDEVVAVAQKAAAKLPS